jgi:hypothetical protein
MQRKTKDYLGDLGIHERMILKWIQVVRVWTQFKWLRIGFFFWKAFVRLVMNL